MYLLQRSQATNLLKALCYQDWLLGFLTTTTNRDQSINFPGIGYEEARVNYHFKTYTNLTQLLQWNFLHSDTVNCMDRVFKRALARIFSAKRLTPTAEIGFITNDLHNLFNPCWLPRCELMHGNTLAFKWSQKNGQRPRALKWPFIELAVFVHRNDVIESK